jgi:hypothetical protein
MPDDLKPPHDARPQRAPRAAALLAPGGDHAGVVYGVITVGALLAAESGRHETYPETLGSVLIAVGLYWLAHAYAGLVASRLSDRERLTPATLWLALVRDWAIVRGAALPLAVVALGWAFGATQQTALSAGLWSAVAGIFAFELAAAVRSRAKPAELPLQLGVGLTMGLAILALRIVVS